jgi:hypothetical protein
MRHRYDSVRYWNIWKASWRTHISGPVWPTVILSVFSEEIFARAEESRNFNGVAHRLLWRELHRLNAIRQRSPIQSPLDFDPWISMDIHGHEEPTLCLTQLQAIISNLFQDISMVFCGTGSSFAGGAGDSFGCRAQDVWRDLGPGIWNWWRHGRRGKRQWYRMEAASKAGDFMVICQYVNLKHAQSRVVF